MKSVELNIDGMKCVGCVNRIKNALSTIKEIDSYDISLEDKKLTLVVKKDKAIEKTIKKIKDLGFEVY